MKSLEKILAHISLVLIIALIVLNLFYSDNENYHKYNEIILNIIVPFAIYFFIRGLIKIYKGFSIFFKKNNRT